jgi:circadian clock protein KaiC
MADMKMAVATTGIPGLDNILRGGFPAARTDLLQGVPGSGKTTLALQMLLEGARRGERTLYITLSESRDELMAVAQGHGWDLGAISIFEMGMQAEQLDDNDQTLFHPAEVDLRISIERILTEVARVKPSRVVFDSLTELRLLSQDALRYRRQLLTLKQRLAAFKATVLLLDDLSLPSEGRLVESIVHGVIALDRISTNYGTIRRRILVEKLRGLDFRTGYHDYIIERGGLSIFPRLVASEHHAEGSSDTAASGVPQLDVMLGGGIRRGSSTLVIGPAGAGKSSIVTAFIHTACTRGEKAVVWTFEETREIFLERASGLGMELRPLIEQGKLSVRTVDPAEVSPGELAHGVKRDVENGVKLVAIDSLSGYLHAMPEEKHLHLHLHELLTYLNQQGVVTFLTLAQSGMITPIQPTDISYIADNVLLIRYFEAFGRVKKAISVVKKRIGGHQDSIRELMMTGNRIQIGEPLTKFQGILKGTPTFTGNAADILAGDRG